MNVYSSAGNIAVLLKKAQSKDVKMIDRLVSVHENFHKMEFIINSESEVLSWNIDNKNTMEELVGDLLVLYEEYFA